MLKAEVVAGLGLLNIPRQALSGGRHVSLPAWSPPPALPLPVPNRASTAGTDGCPSGRDGNRSTRRSRSGRRAPVVPGATGVACAGAMNNKAGIPGTMIRSVILCYLKCPVIAFV